MQYQALFIFTSFTIQNNPAPDGKLIPICTIVNITIPPSEEEAKRIIDELTNHDQSYDEQFYINQVQYYGSVFAREFIHDKTDEINKQINNKDFVRMKTPTGYGYCNEALIEFGIKEGYSQQKGKFVIEVSWDIDNACRKYWWGGKNPRALRKE